MEGLNTRRNIKLPKGREDFKFTGNINLIIAGKHGEEYPYAECVNQFFPSVGSTYSVKCPYRKNDILYVRETWCKDKYGYMYRANYSDGEKFYRDGAEVNVKWKPSIHMPKEAARIFLKVKDVRVERLQDIDDKGAYEEGAGEKDAIYYIGGRVCDFAKIWNSTIKKSDLAHYGWDANPYVWVIEFSKMEVEQ